MSPLIEGTRKRSFNSWLPNLKQSIGAVLLLAGNLLLLATMLIRKQPARLIRKQRAPTLTCIEGKNASHFSVTCRGRFLTLQSPKKVIF